MVNSEKMAEMINAIASQQLENTKASLRLQAKLDVQSMALGLTLSSLSSNTKLVANLQTGLEMASERLLPRNEVYDQAFATEIDALLEFLPKN